MRVLPHPAPARVRVAVLVWLAMLGVDFLLNGSFFARLYQDGGSFLLPPMEAFRRIPLGYLAFLLVAFGIVEFEYRLGIKGLRGGIAVGLVLGGVGALVWSLSVFSIASITVLQAVAFAVAWLAIVQVGSGVAAQGLTQMSLRKLTVGVASFDFVCVGLAIAMQSFGIVTTVSF